MNVTQLVEFTKSFLVFACLICAASIFPSNICAQEKKAALESADAAFAKGHYKRAISLYRNLFCGLQNRIRDNILRPILKMTSPIWVEVNATIIK